MALTADFQKLTVDGLIHLYELDASKLGAGILRFHSHTQSGTIYFKGQAFSAISMQVTGLEMRSDGKASSPTLTFANQIDGVNGAMTAYCHQFQDFAGAKLKVISTLAEYLDGRNFSPAQPNPRTQESKEQIWYISQKTSHNAHQITFELANPIDFDGLRIPTRQITNFCHWCVMGNYRGEECGYTGSKMFDEKNNPVTNRLQDKCNGLKSGCKARGNLVRFGGFPAASLMR